MDFASTLCGAVNEAKDSVALLRRERNNKKSNVLSDTRSASSAFLPWQPPALLLEGTLYIDTALPRSLHDYIIYIHINIEHTYSVELRIFFLQIPQPTLKKKWNAHFCNASLRTPHWSFRVNKKTTKNENYPAWTFAAAWIGRWMPFFFFPYRHTQTHKCRQTHTHTHTRTLDYFFFSALIADSSSQLQSLSLLLYKQAESMQFN